ncbi:MAG: DUF2332 domain-containing protein [Rhizobiaceae bacterium]
MSGNMETENLVRKSFADQAIICGKLGSRFMENLLSGLAEHLDKSTRTGKCVLEWPGAPESEKDALALRLAGALHALVRRGELTELSKYYQNPVKAAEPDFLPLVMSTIAEKDDEIFKWLDFAPQTNETARASVIYSGLLVLAEKYQLPISLFELGSSGGLNLQLAEFGYEFDDKSYGSPRSRVQLNPEWQGDLPPDVKIEIVSRNGCDLNPLSVENAQDREKLVAYLWPDQPARIVRAQAAIEIARKDPPALDRADASAWTESAFATTGQPEMLRVLFHTIAWNYFPQDTKDRITSAMEKAGSRSREECPLAWLSFEFDENSQPLLMVKTWPGGEKRVLASADPHVYGINWN